MTKRVSGTDAAWAAVAARRKRGTRYVTYFEMLPLVQRCSIPLTDDLDIGDPDVQISYVCAFLVQIHFYQAGYRPPPVSIFGHN